jgi:alanine dehydrogenase
MFAKIAGFLGLSVLQLVILGGGIAAAGLWFWNEKRVAYNNGYNVAVAECNEKIRKETDRINQAQDDALVKAMELLTKILKDKDDLNAELEKLKEEALADPDAAKCGLSIGGVRRTNRVR